MNISAAGKQQGLTLIEVLVALVLFSLLSLGSFRLLNSTAGVVAGASAVANDVQQQGRAMAIIARDVRHMVSVIGALPAEEFAEPGIASAVSVNDGKSLEFSRANTLYLPGTNSSAVTRLRYRLLAKDDSPELQLVRDLHDADTAIQDSSLQQTHKPQIVLSEVREFQIRVQDVRGKWHFQWPISQPEEPQPGDRFSQPEYLLPAAIEVTLNTDTREMLRVFSMR